MSIQASHPLAQLAFDYSNPILRHTYAIPSEERPQVAFEAAASKSCKYLGVFFDSRRSREKGDSRNNHALFKIVVNFKV